MAKPLLGPIVAEKGQSAGCLADSTSTNESGRNNLLSEINYLLDQLVPSEGP